MAYRMAYEHSDLIAAIYSFAGSLPENSKTRPPPNPVSILQAHGTADTMVSYERGVAAFERWGRFYGGNEVIMDKEKTLDLDLKVPGLDATISRFSGCPEGIDVELWTVDGGGHWPTVANDDGSCDHCGHFVDWFYAHPKP